MQSPAFDLYCLPCAGASASMYLHWRRMLPAWINVIPVELPGRGTRLEEPFVEAYESLVVRLCNESCFEEKKPWAIFGHSMGALLAYGITLRLQSLGAHLPSILFASGCSAPRCQEPSRFPDTNSDAALIADLRKQGGTPEAVFGAPALLGITLDTLRADYRVCESFSYGEFSKLGSVAIPMHVFAGRDDIEPRKIEPWRDEARDSFTLTWFGGGHFFIREHEQQVLAVMVKSLGEMLEEECHARTAIA